MDTNTVINDYIENFDLEVSNFNDFMVMANDYKIMQELQDCDID
ncbi:MAG TPA: hypothetical protein PLC25_04805 [Bacilli bacterium]|nr:hypothetical protein [Bacilli bacterium]